MGRAKDLDMIAPDDYLEEEMEPKVVKKKKKIKRKKPADSPKRTVLAGRNEYREKVYELLKNRTKTPLSSFLANPKVFTFDGRDEDEEILLVLRKHWFTNLKWILVGLVMFFLPTLLPLIPATEIFPIKFNIVFLLFWYIVSFAYIFENFLSWYFNVFVITDERVIDMDFHNLIDKKIGQADIAMIQDVSAKTGGVSQTLLNYGTVLVQTAAEVNVIKVEKVPNPLLVLKILQEMREEEKEEEIEGRRK